jgi:hypothetical protein
MARKDTGSLGADTSHRQFLPNSYRLIPHPFIFIGFLSGI